VTRQETIEARIREALDPTHLAVVNESSKHNVPKGSETHFHVTVVSQAFEGLLRVERHRRIHQLVATEMASGLHALTLDLATPSEHAKKTGAPLASPQCLGGSKA
jgi:BolA family transcriptional regulator, general stress-responsive regulator